MRITGSFEVELSPAEWELEGEGGVALGRLRIRKTFHGPLNGTSRGEMLSARRDNEAGYVALEQVQGSLEGREGSFVLQHFGTLGPAGQRLLLEVTPGSGSGALAGLSGVMQIRIEDGRHFYDFDYELQDSTA